MLEPAFYKFGKPSSTHSKNNSNIYIILQDNIIVVNTNIHLFAQNIISNNESLKGRVPVLCLPHVQSDPPLRNAAF